MNLFCLYMLDHSASGRQLVVMVEQLASNHDNTSLMAQIVEQIGLTTPSELVVIQYNSILMMFRPSELVVYQYLMMSRVVERLRLCQRFFPAFQQVISEVQELLGIYNSSDCLTVAMVTYRCTFTGCNITSITRTTKESYKMTYTTIINSSYNVYIIYSLFSVKRYYSQ